MSVSYSELVREFGRDKARGMWEAIMADRKIEVLIPAPRVPPVVPLALPAKPMVVREYTEHPFRVLTTAELATRLEVMSADGKIRFKFNDAVGWITKEMPTGWEPATGRYIAAPPVWRVTEGIEEKRWPGRRVRRRYDVPMTRLPLGATLITPGPPTWVYEFVEPERVEKEVKTAKRTDSYSAALVAMRLEPRDFMLLRPK